ncbi:methyltransferase family protein [Hymenobacter elongatus]|uniref:DUF1295 domain-containing protein n=1 Tax=Hymenobacter elongatus TaxID=877208 RepID=A0A4Z0PR73_9BACT|nr:DUF1295 domain-containing protein [Hymenobacter elongatus]TGE20138.1 DUF1295 domain-containing protein [Hymenobacter elongatus]
MVVLAVLWILYYMLHSLLATLWVKNRVAQRWPRAFRFYRLGYNQLSVWLFMAIVRYQLSLPALRLLPYHPALLVLGGVLLAAGVAVAVLAIRGYDVGEFAGWRYVRHGAGAADTPLQVEGLNRVVRHPLYLGLLLLLAGIWLLLPTTTGSVFVGCAVLYILLGTRLEERKLLRRFGAAYVRYQQRVPQLLPRIA